MWRPTQTAKMLRAREYIRKSEHKPQAKRFDGESRDGESTLFIWLTRPTFSTHAYTPTFRLLSYSHVSSCVHAHLPPQLRARALVMMATPPRCAQMTSTMQR